VIAGNTSLLILPQRIFASLDEFSLLAVPLFVLTGELMSRGGITEGIVRLARALMGHLRGGLAQANISANMFMAAISGSALADLVAVGSIMIPAMTRDGYRKEYSVAVTSCAALMAPIIPPEYRSRHLWFAYRRFDRCPVRGWRHSRYSRGHQHYGPRRAAS
jgi:C4-dicarboxylate transporter DctM subunit